MITDDLFIGAWVSYYGEIGTVAMLNGETCAIWRNGDMSKEENYIATAAMAPLFPGDLNPIPLTLNILEKNGFKYKESINRWCFKSTQFGLCKIEDCFIGVICGMYRYIKYVHELQQLLKLATINYKINIMDDNFQKSIVEITEEEQRLDKYAEYVKLMEKSLYTITATPVAAAC